MKRQVVYKRHYQQLIKLIKRNYAITIVLIPDEDCWVSYANPWMPNNQRITIGTKDRPAYVLMALSHELGHCLSVRQKINHTTLAEAIAHHFSSLPPTKKQKAAILKEERQAWRLGFKFLRDHNLPVTEDMQRARRILLDTHKIKRS